MAKYTVRFVHKVSNPQGYTPGDDIEIPDGFPMFDRVKLGKLLRAERVLLSGARVTNVQYADSGSNPRIAVFPSLPGFTTYWHSVILQQVLPDFRVENHGSIVVLFPQSPAAFDWGGENLPSDALRWGHGWAIEPRYVDVIVEGIKNDGLEVI